ncbi:MAG TPA: hypothetical protein VHP58_03845 [Alphaproteobacteria bacterium]|nr:hypothetical protein [Alphaproteobacteria bacterium]
MLTLIRGGIPDVGRAITTPGGASTYAATRTNVETAPLTAAEGAMPSKGRRQGERRPSRRNNQPSADKTVGQNVDIEV